MFNDFRPETLPLAFITSVPPDAPSILRNALSLLVEPYILTFSQDSILGFPLLKLNSPWGGGKGEGGEGRIFMP